MDLNDRPLAAAPYQMLPPVPAFTLTSEEISEGDPIPLPLTGLGLDLSPSLFWEGFPEETKSFVISCFDPDAPTPAGFWHWTVVGVPANVTSLVAGAGGSDETLPEGAFHVRNDGSEHSYMGPYPPQGDRPHRYYFAVHALDVDTLDVDENSSPTAVAFNALFHTIGRGVLMGTFEH